MHVIAGGLPGVVTDFTGKLPDGSIRVQTPRTIPENATQEEIP